jgi:hypothetical protein
LGYDTELNQPLAREDWEQREIYAHFGLAIYFCQVVETGLVNYLLVLRRATAKEKSTVTEIDEVFTLLFGRTFGRNISSVKRILGEHGSWILADQMGEALALRNELVHHWMRKRSLKQGTSENRNAMIDELQEAVAKLEAADHALGERTQLLMTKAGMPEDFVAIEHQRLMDLAGRGEIDPDAPEYYSVTDD